MFVEAMKGMLGPKAVIFMVIGFLKGYLMMTVLAADSLLHLTLSMHSEEQDSPALAQSMKAAIAVANQTLVPGSVPHLASSSGRGNPPEIEMGTLAAHSVEDLLSTNASPGNSGGKCQVALIETQHSTI
jgi:hypothetical protein